METKTLVFSISSMSEFRSVKKVWSKYPGCTYDLKKLPANFLLFASAKIESEKENHC